MTPTRDSETLRVPAFKRKKALKAKVAKAQAKNKTAKRLSPRLKQKTKIRAVMVKKVAVARKPRTLAPTPRKTSPRLQPVGMVTHYYDRINVGVLKLSSMLRVGDRLRLRGKSGEFDQIIQSIQENHQPVAVAAKGADIGVKVDQEVRTDQMAYKILG